jgi:hypothetical protein
MQEIPSLESYLQEYYRGDLDKKELEGLIFEFVLKNAKRFHLVDWDEEECIDYLCWLYPRLSRAIEKYTSAGASFDAYLSTMIRYSSREYRFIEADHYTSERSYWNASMPDMEVHSREPEYAEAPEYPETTAKVFRPVENPRQVLLLLLKSYFFVSDDYIEKAAPAIGIKRETLKHLVNNLRQLRHEREEEHEGLKERIYSQYYRCITFERRLNSAVPGSARYYTMRDRLERARKRLAAMRKRLGKIRVVASNRQVARILGVPKGTVDSNLHAAKTRVYRNDEYPEDFTYEYGDDEGLGSLELGFDDIRLDDWDDDRDTNQDETRDGELSFKKRNKDHDEEAAAMAVLKK